MPQRRRIIVSVEKQGFLGGEIKHYRKRLADDYQEVLSFYVQVNQFAQTFKYELKPLSTEARKVTLVTLFLKALLSYQSIYVLITHCLSNDVESLLRGFFEVVLKIKYCTLSEECFKRYAYSHTRKILGWITEAMQHPDEFPKEMQTKGDLKQRLEELRKELNQAGNPERVDTLEMARGCGLMNLYNTFYRPASDSVHGNISDLQQYVNFNTDGHVENFQIGPTLSKESIVMPLIFSVELLLIAIGDLANFFGIERYKDEFSELAVRKDEYAKKFLS